MTERLERDVADVARKWVPDPGLGVLEVSVEPQRVAGVAPSREALAALRRIAADAGRAADIRLLPDASVRDEPAAVVTAAVAPLLREPRIAADRVSEALHGEPLALLERREEGGVWVRVRAGDRQIPDVGPRVVAVARAHGRTTGAGGPPDARSGPSSGSRISASGLRWARASRCAGTGRSRPRTDAPGV